jgi:hypothetical protein
MDEISRSRYRSNMNLKSDSDYILDLDDLCHTVSSRHGLGRCAKCGAPSELHRNVSKFILRRRKSGANSVEVFGKRCNYTEEPLRAE